MSCEHEFVEWQLFGHYTLEWQRVGIIHGDERAIESAREMARDAIDVGMIPATQDFSTPTGLLLCCEYLEWHRGQMATHAKLRN